MPFNPDSMSHASSLRQLARKSGSRVMISNSYRILDYNRVSHEQLELESPPTASVQNLGPTINVSKLKKSQWGKSPVSISGIARHNSPTNRFVTMDYLNSRPDAKLVEGYELAQQI